MTCFKKGCAKHPYTDRQAHNYQLQYRTLESTPGSIVTIPAGMFIINAFVASGTGAGIFDGRAITLKTLRQAVNENFSSYEDAFYLTRSPEQVATGDGVVFNPYPPFIGSIEEDNSMMVHPLENPRVFTKSASWGWKIVLVLADFNNLYTQNSPC